MRARDTRKSARVGTLASIAALCVCAWAMPMRVASAATAADDSNEDAQVYCLDPVHTRAMFAIEHAGFSKAIGTVSGSTGELRFDAAHWPQARLQATVPLARLDLGDAKWNKAALAGNLLDVERYPEARFVSTRVEPLDEQRATVHGMLTLHGTTQAIALDVKLNAMKRHPLPPFRRTVGFSATGRLSRSAFGIDAWPSVIGDEVELRIEAEATRGRCDGGDTETAATDDTSPKSIDRATNAADADSSSADRTGESDRSKTPTQTPTPSHAPETPR